ncbi:MAG: hypothetical protein RLZZ196_2334 [Bacteroidota bacterium]|jgi:hypothetical protein
MSLVGEKTDRYYVYKTNSNKIGILLMDFRFWANNYIKLSEWCQFHQLSYQLTGSLLELNTQEELLLFTLYWHE